MSGSLEKRTLFSVRSASGMTGRGLTMAKPKPARFTDIELAVLDNMVKAHIESDITGPMLITLGLKIRTEQLRRKQQRDEHSQRQN